MAIAPLDDTKDGARSDGSGLRLVRGDRPAGATTRGTARHAASERTEALRRSRAAHPTAQSVGVPLRVPSAHGPTVEGARRATARRPAAIRRGTASRAPTSSSTLARRQRTAGAGAVLVALVLLALPLHALGAVSLDGRATPGGVPGGLAAGSVYVVQPGDTIASIAARVNLSQAAAIERDLVASTGSRTVVPGEHVVIP
jgi:LysM repeat protein